MRPCCTNRVCSRCRGLAPEAHVTYRRLAPKVHRAGRRLAPEETCQRLAPAASCTCQKLAPAASCPCQRLAPEVMYAHIHVKEDSLARLSLNGYTTSTSPHSNSDKLKPLTKFVTLACSPTETKRYRNKTTSTTFLKTGHLLYPMNMHAMTPDMPAMLDDNTHTSIARTPREVHAKVRVSRLNYQISWEHTSRCRTRGNCTMFENEYRHTNNIYGTLFQIFDCRLLYEIVDYLKKPKTLATYACVIRGGIRFLNFLRHNKYSPLTLGRNFTPNVILRNTKFLTIITILLSLPVVTSVDPNQRSDYDQLHGVKV